METAVQSSNEYRNLPVAQLQESTTNPRRRFDERSLAELAATFQSQGVLQPLLVRTIEDDKYEVITGARRLRAPPNSPHWAKFRYGSRSCRTLKSWSAS